MYQRWLVIMTLLLLSVLSACNLGNVPETEEPLPVTEQPTLAAGKPVVTIISPQSGDEFEVNKQILVSMTATDSQGVTGVQLVVNGAVVKRVAPANPAGEKTYSAALDYTPRAAGDVTMQVIAFRGPIASDPAQIDVTIVSATTGGSTGGTGSTDSGSGTSGVIIPNDGVCRALTTLNLNFRAQPSTSSTVITVLPGGTLAPVVARLGDNSWWKITFNNQNGWVSAQFTTLSGNCLNVPVESLATATPTRTPTPIFTLAPTLTPPPTNTPTPLQPDLVVPNISGSTAVKLNGGSVTVTYSVTVSNTGLGAAGQFTITLQVNGTQVETWVVSGLDKGQSVALTKDLTWDTAGSFALRVDADTENKIAESIEINNRGDITVTVSN